MGSRTLFVCLLGLAIAAPVAAQAAPPATQPLRPQGLAPGWEEIDQRFLFLAEQLMLVENEVVALNKALVRAGYQQAIQQANAERAVKGNELMDRRGGGPVDWWTFYGTTAEKFFYHPNGPNDFYHTQTLLVQRPAIDDVAKEQGVASRQGLPVHQRPPQFDYFYRANDQARQRAEKAAAAMGRDVQRLLAQRRQREATQAELWCLLSLRGVSRLELARRPTYRFNLKIAGNDPAKAQRQETITATSNFVRTMDHFVTEAQESVEWAKQGETFGALKKVIAASQKELDQVLLKQPALVNDLENNRTAVGMVSAAANRLIDASQNLLDAQQAILEKERAGDDLNKQRHRAILQQAIFDVAANVQTLDQCFRVLVKEWGGEPDVEKGLIASPTSAPLVASGSNQKPTTDADAALQTLQWTPSGKYQISFGEFKLVVNVVEGRLKEERYFNPNERPAKWKQPNSQSGSGSFKAGSNGLPILHKVGGYLEEWSTSDGGQTVQVRQWKTGLGLKDTPTAVGKGTKLD